MLPDFPSLTRDLVGLLDSRVRAARGGIPFAEQLPPFQQHEGDRLAVTRANGSVISGSYNDPVKATVTLTAEVVRAKGARASYDALAGIQEQLDEGLARRTVAAIEDAAASVGNTVDLKGTPLTGAAILDVYERIELSFTTDGRWVPLRFLAHPDTAHKVDAAMAEIDRDPALAARRTAIVNLQREAWRGREARRTLVD